MEDDLWIFGYGSLVWGPDFPFRERHPAYIEGWIRRFWQGSTDHRGVPGAPGRVVTLLPEADSICWGMAYNIGGAESEATLAHLDYREKGGYQVEQIVLNFEGGNNFADGLVYVASPENPNYLGFADPFDIARQVCASHGPSGPNDEYVLKLAEALREIGADDPHVFEIESVILRG